MEGQDVTDLSVFLDFRLVRGDSELVGELRQVVVCGVAVAQKEDFSGGLCMGYAKRQGKKNQEYAQHAERGYKGWQEPQFMKSLYRIAYLVIFLLFQSFSFIICSRLYPGSRP